MLQSASPANNNDVMDVATNSFNEAYFRSRLTEEVHRAKLASDDVALLNIEFSGFENLTGRNDTNDAFAFGPSGSLVGLVTGGEGRPVQRFVLRKE